MAHKFRVSADPSSLFSALVCSYLKAAYYSGLAAASPVLQTVALVWNVGYLENSLA